MRFLTLLGKLLSWEERLLIKVKNADLLKTFIKYIFFKNSQFKYKSMETKYAFQQLTQIEFML